MDLLIGDDVGRQEIENVAQWPEEYVPLEELGGESRSDGVEVAAAFSVLRFYIESGKSSDAARIADWGKVFKFPQTLAEELLDLGYPRENFLFFEDVEVLQSDGAGQCVGL